MKVKQKKGISLIVLVITIIVMIILAAAIILSLNGSGVIGEANKAKLDSDTASKKEAAALYLAEYRLGVAEGKIDSNKKSATDYVRDKLASKGIDPSDVVVTDSGEIHITKNAPKNTYTDKNGDKAIIPEGFVVSQADGESIIKGGLVIYEGTETVTNSNVDIARETRNQFVWIPVDDFSKFERTSTYNGMITPPVTGNDYSTCVEPFSGTTISDVTISEANDITGEHAEYKAMRASVKQNKGFYIARYEAGTNVVRTGNGSDGTTEVYVQKNRILYNNVSWSPNQLEGIVTGETTNFGKGAVELSRNFYKNSTSVVSTLCYGVQWDSALQFIYKINPNYVPKGNLPGDGTAIKTGAVEDYAINNIYDMAGNGTEWTMESYKDDYYGDGKFYINRMCRGGHYYNTGTGDDSSRYTAGEPALTFRIALYLK